MRRTTSVKFLTSILKQKVNAFQKLASFFIVLTHNSSVNFKLKHFVLWIKRPHQSPNFETFKCSSKNLQNSCHFLNQKSVFLQILHHSSVLRWLLCTFLWQALYTLHKKNQSKCKFCRIECSGQNSPSSCHFWKNKSVFFNFFIILQCNETKLLCTFLAEIYIFSTKGA